MDELCDEFCAVCQANRLFERLWSIDADGLLRDDRNGEEWTCTDCGAVVVWDPVIYALADERRSARQTRRGRIA